MGKNFVLTGHYSRVNLDDMQLTGAPVYRLSMIAEAYATKGIFTTLQPFFLQNPGFAGYMYYRFVPHEGIRVPQNSNK